MRWRIGIALSLTLTLAGLNEMAPGWPKTSDICLSAAITIRHLLVYAGMSLGSATEVGQLLSPIVLFAVTFGSFLAFFLSLPDRELE